jgi:hypothetical protein
VQVKTADTQDKEVQSAAHGGVAGKHKRQSDPGTSTPSPDAPEGEGDRLKSQKAGEQDPVKENRPSLEADATYKPTPQEQVLLEQQRVRAAGNVAPGVALKTDEREERCLREISLRHPNLAIGSRLFMEALGTADRDFLNGLINQLGRLHLDDALVAEGKLNFILSVIKDIKPRDHLESMLAAQMAVTHVAMMGSAEHLMRIEDREGRQLYEGAHNRLARTFAAQLEALKRYRTGGEQRITVQHVQNVSVEGPAIVGNVTHTASNNAPEPIAAAPIAMAPALTHNPQPTIPIIDEPPRTPAPVKAPVQRRRTNGR